LQNARKAALVHEPLIALCYAGSKAARTRREDWTHDFGKASSFPTLTRRNPTPQSGKARINVVARRTRLVARMAIKEEAIQHSTGRSSCNCGEQWIIRPIDCKLKKMPVF
jgi:hypothetical protein